MARKRRPGAQAPDRSAARQRVTIDLSVAMAKALRFAAADRDQEYGEIVEKALHDWMKDKWYYARILGVDAAPAEPKLTVVNGGAESKAG